MSEKTTLYIVRHGKTMFNTLGRAQGWSDTPLTPFGEEGIHELGAGLKAENIPFKAAFSSDSGRTIQTMDIIMEHLEYPNIPYLREKRIREWCFGSMDGGFDGELFDGILPRTDAYKGKDLDNLSFEDIARGIMEIDTAGWAEPWEKIKDRIYTGFEDIAHKLHTDGGGNALIVSHGMTIATFCHLVHPENPRVRGLDNGSVTIVSYDGEQFTVENAGLMKYREIGRKRLAK
ncbi:probable phosphoglycerate mutase [Pilibacter termitis]|uniref:Probable phosphoglycerate mutase n=1 Tax=Pilibacter termitis TaxID=263852 RepID=A0A1T4K2L1_9ENTE|nr:histidine phosphatase family protein [Pilibacter termitis]SJZ36696.1 probable phosphoglycerate mutase [Pilibacter termitis]